MLLAGIVASALMGSGAAVMAMDSTLGRRAAYALHRWRRARRSSRAAAN